MEKDLLKICLEKVELVFNRGEIYNYGDYQFKKLSEEIQDNTGVSVSVQTLKRLYGRISYKGEYSPQPATKNALAKYIGYEDWDDFAIHHEIKEKSLLKSKQKKSLIYIVPLLLVLGVLFLFIRNGTNKTFEFALKHPVGTAPHTSLFVFDVSDFKNKDAGINFRDWTKAAEIEGEGSISHLFLLPDLYRPELYIGSKKVASTKVYVKSTGWESAIIGPKHRTAELYIPLCKNITTLQQMDLDKSFLSAKKLDTNNLFHYKLRNVQDFGVLTDSITAKATIKLNTSIFQPTQHMSFRLIGDSADFTVTFAPPGNFGNAYIDSDDNRISGKNTDLKALEQDFSDWKTVAISVVKNKAYIYVNDSLIIQNDKITTPGSLMGISFSFMHGGYLRDFSISKSGEEVYRQSFQ